MRGIPEEQTIKEIVTIKDVKAKEPKLKGRLETVIQGADTVTDKNHVKYLPPDIS